VLEWNHIYIPKIAKRDVPCYFRIVVTGSGHVEEAQAWRLFTWDDFLKGPVDICSWDSNMELKSCSSSV
jgi:hypothetical protein